ncbi:DolP-mannose mannosyltransferase [Halobaculum sp. EA56]|uniref:DolP-mannose mannosyltransferase n=1 Tax=Halobaculum sp. EA56 TaxID=3421648 RepID=UPI003EB86582
MAERQEFGLPDRFPGSAGDAIPGAWVSVPVFVTALLQVTLLARVLLAYTRPPMTPDAGVFQQIGWYIAHGGRLYVDTWDPKPPLPFETTAALALVSGGNVYVHHLLSVALMVLVACGIVALVCLLCFDLTGDRYASALAGLSMLLLPGFFVRPVYGFKAKYPLLLAGLLAVYLYRRDRPALAGAAAAASVGYWQGALVFPCIVVGLAARTRDPRQVTRVVAGGVGFAALVVLPVVVLWRSVPEMIVQAVIVPLALPEEASLLEHVYGGVIHFKWASPLVLVGAWGLADRALDLYRRDLGPVVREDWWVVVGGAWFGLLVLFVDFEIGGYTDLIPGLAFVALGVGMAAARLSGDRSRRVLSAALVGVLLVNVVGLGSMGLVFSPVETPGPVAMDELRTNERAVESPYVPDDTPDVRYLYWTGREPETCHYRLSLMEARWLRMTNGGPSEGCSDLGTALSALRDRGDRGTDAVSTPIATAYRNGPERSVRVRPPRDNHARHERHWPTATAGGGGNGR